MSADASIPVVSIGLPVWNGAGYLRQALESLLQQRFRHFEILVSDNASTDGTPEICREFAARDGRIVYERLPENCGGTANFNRVARLARGKYFMWAAHDDLWHPEYVSRCLEILEQDPAAVLCHSVGQPIAATTDLPCGSPYWGMTNEAPNARERWRYAMEHWEIHAAVYGLIRREALLRTRLVLPRLSSDLILMAELSLQGTVRQIPAVLQWKRVPGSPEGSRSARETLRYVGGGRPPLLYLHRFATAVSCTRGLLRMRPRPAGRARMVLDTWAVYLVGGRWLMDVKEVVKDALAALGLPLRTRSGRQAPAKAPLRS